MAPDPVHMPHQAPKTHILTGTQPLEGVHRRGGGGRQGWDAYLDTDPVQ